MVSTLFIRGQPIAAKSPRQCIQMGWAVMRRHQNSGIVIFCFTPRLTIGRWQYWDDELGGESAWRSRFRHLEMPLIGAVRQCSAGVFGCFNYDYKAHHYLFLSLCFCFKSLARPLCLKCKTNVPITPIAKGKTGAKNFNVVIHSFVLENRELTPST